MTDSEIKQTVKRFSRELGIRGSSYTELEDALETLGYTVVEFNRVVNDEPVATLIKALRLTGAVSVQRGFTYADANRRIVFIQDSLSEQEKSIILAHEAGHIYCGHMTANSILGKDVREEYEANEFAHYLLNPDGFSMIKSRINAHRKYLIIALCSTVIAASLITALLFIRQGAKYYGDYYVTETGNKYHTSDCSYVKDKNNIHRLTKTEFESGLYKPCDKCISADTDNGQ